MKERNLGKLIEGSQEVYFDLEIGREILSNNRLKTVGKIGVENGKGNDNRGDLKNVRVFSSTIDN